MDLQPLFGEPILEQRYLDRDYSGFGNDVWIVRTHDEHVVVRVSARSGAGGAFWSGLGRLFDIDSTDMDRLHVINEFVNANSGFRSPRVLRTGMIEGRAYTVTELMPGRHVDSFDNLPLAAARAFGRALALSHQRTIPHCGSPAARVSYPAAEFHGRAAETIEWLCHEYRAGDKRALAAAAESACKLRAIPSPPVASLILTDIGGSQYLWSDDGPTAVVDTEAYAFAPRELELIVLESDNGGSFAEAFRLGYETICPIPDLSAVREPYRCLIALLEVNGVVALDDAVRAPVHF
jgi:hypothetical protein